MKPLSKDALLSALDRSSGTAGESKLIDAALRELDSGPSSRPSRNPTCTFTFNRSEYFAKSIIGHNSFERSRRALAYEWYRQSYSMPLRLNSPSLFAIRQHGTTDGEMTTLVYEYVETLPTQRPDSITNSASLAWSNLASNNANYAHFFQALGAFHSPPPAHDDMLMLLLSPLSHPLPPVSVLSALTPEQYSDSSMAELKLYNRLHSDALLFASCTKLRGQSGTTPKVAIHGDLRLDQLLTKADNTQYLIDWEEFRLGDPAIDIGSILGDMLYRSLFDLSTVGDAAVGNPINARDVAAAITERIARMIDFVNPGVGAYLESTKQARWAETTCRFLERASAYAGWQLIERPLVAARHSASLPSHLLAIAGVGQQLMRRPNAFANQLG